MLMASLVWILIGLLIVLVCSRIVWRATMPPRKGVKIPSCERCGYAVSGLTSLTCPECGSDFRAVGIITRAMEVKRRGTYIGAIIAATFGSLTVADLGDTAVDKWYWSGAFVSPVPTVSQTTSAVTFRISVDLMPDSYAYKKVTVSEDGNASFGRSSSPWTIDLVLATGEKWTLEFDRASGTSEVLDPSGATIGPARVFDRQSVETLFTLAGLSITDPAVAAEVEELHRILYAGMVANASVFGLSTFKTQAFQMGTADFPGNPTKASRVSAPGRDRLHRYLVWFNWLLGGVLWIGGIAWIVWRRHKLLRKYTPRAAPKPA